MMAMRCEERGIPYVKNSRMYEWVRKEFVKCISLNSKGEKNSQFNTQWICNIDLQENKKIQKDSNIPIGWIIGRNVWKLSWPRTLTCEKCNVEFVSNTKRKYCSRKCIPTTKGLKFSDDIKQKMSLIKKDLYKDPTKNPMYGKRKNK
jgi:hypothetical protein